MPSVFDYLMLIHAVRDQVAPSITHSLFYVVNWPGVCKKYLLAVRYFFLQIVENDRDKLSMVSSLR